MTTHDDIETRLRQAFEVAPSEDARRALDARVARAMTQPVAERDWRFGGSRPLLRALAIAAALALAAGTVAATLTLLERLANDSTPGVLAAWDNAELVNLTDSDAGVTITLERAYADLNQVAVFFTVEGLEPATSGAGDIVPLEWTAELTDPAGRSGEEWAGVRGGTEGYELGVSANVHTWEGPVTPSAGTWRLTFTSIGYNGDGFTAGECDADATAPACASPTASAMVEGSWEFAFELPEPAGTLVATDQAASEGQVTVTVTEFRIAPSMISATMALRVDGVVVTSWATANNTLVSIEGPAGTYTANTTYHVTQDPDDQGPNGDVNLFLTSEGTDEASGSWQITIPELWYATDYAGPETAEILDEAITLTVDAP